MTPDISVVIPTYNRAALVERAIASISEPGLDVEVIVVDDGSTDDTRDRLECRNDIRYIRLPANAGQAVARNAGIAAASAPRIAFLDSDDCRVAGTLERQLEILDSNSEAALVYAGYRLTTDAPGTCRGTFVEPDAYESLLAHNVISPCAAIVRQDVLAGMGAFDPRFRRSEEWELWLRICARRTVAVLREAVVVVEPPLDDSHASGDPVKIETSSAEVIRQHLRSGLSRAQTPIERKRVERTFIRTRIDLMLWKVLSRGRDASLELRLRCAAACWALDPAYMLAPHSLKSLAKLMLKHAAPAAA